jgi:phage terminase Nu1 subunit (DNA packaging protein)
VSNVIAFPQRKIEGETWEPWTDERNVAGYFGVDPRTIRRWRKNGMPSEIFGGVRRYRLSECQDWHRKEKAA